MKNDPYIEFPAIFALYINFAKDSVFSQKDINRIYTKSYSKITTE